jgi:hypothetical protein
VNKQRDVCIFVVQFSQNIGKCAVDSRNVCSGKCYSARLKSQLRRSEVEGNLELPISNSSLLLPLLRTHRASRGQSASGASRDRMNCTHMVVSATFENLNHVYASERLPIPEPS